MEHPILINSRGKAKVSDWYTLRAWSSTMSGQVRQKLAAAMIAPIRRQLDYAGMVRRCLTVEPLEGGALSIYDKGSQ